MDTQMCSQSMKTWAGGIYPSFGRVLIRVGMGKSSREVSVMFKLFKTSK